MSIICGHCRLPIANGEAGVRHFGHYVAHTENRCVSLLSAEIERLRARVAELERALLLIEPSGDFSGWEDKHGRDIGNSINAALAKGSDL